MTQRAANNASETARHSADQRRHTYLQLMRSFACSQHQDAETRWDWLMAAHIVGQHDFSLHWRNHVAMLGFALATRDYPEAAGQLFRLSLVPLGHAIKRLPAGNIGRATVSAFSPMTPDPDLQRLILQAQAQAVADCKQAARPDR